MDSCLKDHSCPSKSQDLYVNIYQNNATSLARCFALYRRVLFFSSSAPQWVRPLLGRGGLGVLRTDAETTWPILKLPIKAHLSSSQCHPIPGASSVSQISYSSFTASLTKVPSADRVTRRQRERTCNRWR